MGTIVEDAVDLAMWDIVPNLMESNDVVKPSNLSHEPGEIIFVL